LDESLRFCPRCGRRRVGFFRYCAGCRLDFEAPDAAAALATPESPLEPVLETITPSEIIDEPVVPIQAVDESMRPVAVATGWQYPDATAGRRSGSGLRYASIGAVLLVGVVAVASFGSNGTAGPSRSAGANVVPEATAATPPPTPTPEPTLSPTPTTSPTPTPTPTPIPTPTPAPTLEAVAVVDDTYYAISSGSRSEFRGAVGTYTFETLSFPHERAIARWTAIAGVGSCRVVWRVVPYAESSIVSSVRVASGATKSGNRSFTTDFSDASLTVESTCDKWVLSLQGAEPAPTPAPPTSSGGSNCHPSYRGACLKRNAGDYDCAGGSGNGPNYVAGPIYVVGYDEFDLDRDGDGIGCE